MIVSASQNDLYKTDHHFEPMILIDEAGMEAIRQPIENAKQVNGKYYGLIEVYHQLHCLNLVRKYIWRDHYSEDISFQEIESQVFEHVSQ